MENNTNISPVVITLIGEELTTRYTAEGNNIVVTGNASNLEELVLLAEEGGVTVTFKGEVNEGLTIYTNDVPLTVEGADEYTVSAMSDLSLEG